MARSPLIIDTPMGRLYCIDLSSGACMLMIEQAGQAITFPMDSQEARRIASYLRAGTPSAMGRPAGAPPIADEQLQEVVTAYTSDEAAAFNGAKARYVAQHLGVTEATVYARLKRARARGMISD